MMTNAIITVFHATNPIAEILLNGEICDVKILDRCAYRYLSEDSSTEDIDCFLSRRVFPNRHDASTADALRSLGLAVYNVEDIIKLTGGKMICEKISIKIEIEDIN